MAKKSKLFLTVCANIVMIFAALVISITSLSFAWYSMNYKASSNGMKMNVEYKEFINQINFYSVAKDDNLAYQEGIYYFNKTKIVDFKMESYSIFDKRYQILIEIILNDQHSNVVVRGNTQTSFYLGNIPSSLDADETLKQTGNPLSNVVRFYSFGTDSTGLSSSNGYYLLNTTNSNPSFKSFVNLTNMSDKHIDNEIVISEVSNCERVYILVDYYEEALNDIYETYLGSSLTSGGVSIEYTSDFSFSLEDGSVQ